nr:MAG TPA: zinc finger domain protein [Bacteriophage sp.]
MQLPFYAFSNKFCRFFLLPCNRTFHSLLDILLLVF